MREEFEKEYRKRGSDRLPEDVEQSLLIGSDGEYVFGLTWTAFYWWQAATALQAERVRELEALAFAIADDSTYDSEYDGRMYTYCAYCGESQERGNTHDEDCHSLVARRLLGAAWPREVVTKADVLDIERLAMIKEMQREKAASRTRCGICNKRVSIEGLGAHQRDNAHCLALSATAREG
jgi:hypothetical protein